MMTLKTIDSPYTFLDDPAEEVGVEPQWNGR